MTDQINLAVWSTAYVNDLPDGAFLYIAPGGEVEEGKTKPRSLRFFPFKARSICRTYATPSPASLRAPHPA